MWVLVPRFFVAFHQFEPHLFVYGSTSLGTVAALRTNRSGGFDELFLAGAFDTVSFFSQNLPTCTLHPHETSLARCLLVGLQRIHSFQRSS